MPEPKEKELTGSWKYYAVTFKIWTQEWYNQG